MSNKKQTAIQELISEFEELKKTKLYETSFKAIDDCIALAYNKLAMEKERIETAFDVAYSFDHNNSDPSAEQYYDKTYEQ